MKVEVWSRLQNERPKKLWEGDLPLLPRVGEWFAVSGDDASWTVHSLSWVVKPEPYVRIDVKV